MVLGVIKAFPGDGWHLVGSGWRAVMDQRRALIGFGCMFRSLWWQRNGIWVGRRHNFAAAFPCLKREIYRVVKSE